MPAALSKIDVSGILFFFGILLSIGALDSAGILKSVAVFLQNHVPSEQIIATAIGMASAVIDNVPLVAATMGMYDLQSNPQVRRPPPPPDSLPCLSCTKPHQLEPVCLPVWPPPRTPPCGSWWRTARARAAACW